MMGFSGLIRSPRSSGLFGSLRRRGVALVLAISTLALLLTFLIAAQTSVMGSLRLIKRSSERLSNARLTDQALTRAYQALGSTTQASGELEIGGQDTTPVSVRYERLETGAEVYGTLPGIAGHREGDAMVAVTLAEGATPHHYLINTRSLRTGAIRVQ